MILVLLGGAAGSACSLWLWSAFMNRCVRSVGLKPPSLSRLVFHEVRPFYLAAVAVGMAGSHGLGGWLLGAAMAGIQLAGWCRYRNDDQDDDRWKRRRRKVAEAVKRAGARLAVEAVPS